MKLLKSILYRGVTALALRYLSTSITNLIDRFRVEQGYMNRAFLQSSIVIYIILSGGLLYTTKKIIKICLVVRYTPYILQNCVKSTSHFEEYE